MESYDYSSQQRKEVAVSSFIRSVYLWMTIGLALSGFVAFYVSGSEAALKFIFGNKWAFIGLIIAEFALVIALSAAINRMSSFVATACFILYAILSGATLASIFIVYPIGTISNAFFVTAGMFLAMSIYGTVTKRDLSGWGSFLIMGLIGVIIASVVNIFLKNSMMDFVICCIGVIVFTGLTAYDTQKLRNIGRDLDANESESFRKYVILGALTLYLDFINLFLMLLRLFGRKN